MAKGFGDGRMTPVADGIDEGICSEPTERIETRVERGFESSRLEEELLALAYERVVPVCARTRGVRAPDSWEDAAVPMNC
jgi:hypothetical protein